jgi:hypothetical protein
VLEVVCIVQQGAVEGFAGVYGGWPHDSEVPLVGFECEEECSHSCPCLNVDGEVVDVGVRSV